MVILITAESMPIKIFLSLHTKVPYGILLLLALPLKICSHAELLFYGLNVVHKTLVIRARNPATTLFRGQGSIWQKALLSSFPQWEKPETVGGSNDSTHSKIIALTSSVVRYHSGINLNAVWVACAASTRPAPVPSRAAALACLPSQALVCIYISPAGISTESQAQHAVP